MYVEGALILVLVQVPGPDPVPAPRPLLRDPGDRAGHLLAAHGGRLLLQGVHGPLQRSAYTPAIFLTSNCVVGSVCGQDPRVLLRHLRLLPGEGAGQQLLEPAPVPPLPPADPPLLLCRHHPLPPGIRSHLLVSCREGGHHY